MRASSSSGTARGRSTPRKARASRRERAAVPDAASIARAAAMLGLEKKARGVVLLDLSEISPRPEVDHFVIMSSVSEPHQRALADHILEGLEERGVKRWHLEGYPSSTWILIDYHDVVVHIFRPESRAFYSLETLWGDARSEQLADEAEDGEARAHAPPPRGGRRERGA